MAIVGAERTPFGPGPGFVAVDPADVVEVVVGVLGLLVVEVDAGGGGVDGVVDWIFGEAPVVSEGFQGDDGGVVLVVSDVVDVGEVVADAIGVGDVDGV